MNRPDLTLTSVLKMTVSHGALEFSFAPKAFAFQIDPIYGKSREIGPLALASSLKAPLSFLAFMQMWLRSILGLEMTPEPLRVRARTYAVPAISYQQVQPAALNKPAAHNLEALMRFAPDGAGRGLTLNQYRERFTRLSVLGRVKLYRALNPSIFGRDHLSQMLCALAGQVPMRDVLSKALLHPD